MIFRKFGNIFPFAESNIDISFPDVDDLIFKALEVIHIS